MLVIWDAGSWLLAPLTHEKIEPLPFAHVSLTAWIALAISGVFCTATTTLLVELGHSPCAGLARRGVSEH